MSADDKTRVLTDVGTATVGTQLSGIYELDKRIASGGMGEVYRGHNIQTGDHVAIKIVLPEFAHNQTILSLVRKEASILNRLSHDAIVRYHVFTVDPGIGRPYLAMEFVDGESLLDVIERGPMSTADVGKLCYRLASGLSAVHEAGAVHRDLSPDNIILPGGKVERAKIIDFGIARSATIGGETLIGGSFAGKYNYVSPEQLGLYGGDVREASDIYSLGLVLAAAMRGRPIEMGGSQLEVLEKRRIVPDLSDIDADFRPIIEAMLQPDPANRPASMAEIAGVMRDGPLLDADRPMVAHSAAPRDHRTGLPQAGQSPFRQGSASPFAANFQGSPTDPTTSSSAAGDPDFFPYVPPAHLSHPRPAMDAAFQAAPPTRPSNRRNIALAATASVVVAVGAAAYFGGLLTPRDQQPAANASETTPPAEVAGARVADAAAVDQPAENVAPAVTETSAPATPPANRMQDTAQDQGVPVVGEVAGADATTTPEAASVPLVAQPAQADAPPATPAQPHVEPATTEPQLAAPAPSTGQQDIASDRQPPAAAEPATAVPEATAVAPLSATPPADQPEHPSEPDSPTAPAVDKAANSDAATATDAPPIPVVVQPKPANEQPAAADRQAPQAGEAGETVVAMNVPPPSVTASDSIDTVADRISWLHDYRGGDCFYATMTSATDKAIEIEGFGTAVAPFEQMLQAFQAKFNVEPDVSVRLIDPAQCEITNFLRALGATTANRPKLALDRTSVPNDTTISGTLETVGGLRTSLLLIDNKGMAFSLDERVTMQSGKGTFNIPISLGAADQADGKPLPQIIVAVTGDVDLSAAAFSKPTAATVVLPKILAEIQAKGLEFAASAKYFRLGG